MKGEEKMELGAMSMHLKGAQAIEDVFGVSRRTVRGWVRSGAPIHLVGRRYQASYTELWQWISLYGSGKRNSAK